MSCVGRPSTLVNYSILVVIVLEHELEAAIAIHYHSVIPLTVSAHDFDYLVLP